MDINDEMYDEIYDGGIRIYGTSERDREGYSSTNIVIYKNIVYELTEVNGRIKLVKKYRDLSNESKDTIINNFPYLNGEIISRE